MVAVVVAVTVLGTCAVASSVAAWRAASVPAAGSARRRGIRTDGPGGWSLARVESVTTGIAPMEVAGWLEDEEPARRWRRLLRFLGLVVLLAAAAAVVAGVILGVIRLANLELARFLRTG